MSPRRHIRSSHRTEKNGVETAELIQDLVAQDLAVSQIPSTAEIEVGGLQFHTRSTNDLECFDGDLGADAVATDDGDAMLGGT